MISVKPGSLKESRPHEYVMRFVFGGLCTAAAGLIAKKFGPGVGGLFLAFPAIFPASSSLVESHEKRRKQETGLQGERRGRDAAAVDAAGAALGAIGLIVFALMVWRLLEGRSAAGVIAAATLAWAVTAGAAWWMRRTLVHVLRRRKTRSASADAAELERR